MFEANMRDLSMRHLHLAGIQQTKRKEMFHAKSRFIVVFKETDLVAYGMFRFEVDESSDVLYCYELQVSSSARRNGLGKMMMQQLWKIGSSWKMEKLMLTVLKGNTTAVEFYKQLNFVIDETSPSKFQQEVDYEIMSSSLCV
ncbi:acyl-CoA N-acyltransferase [Amanita rubescens]|nr:acyl-CoA N-acyltransferase [Amanita rubescens]